MTDITGLGIIAKTQTEIKAAELFREELILRACPSPAVSDKADKNGHIEFICDGEGKKEDFIIDIRSGNITVKAHRLRGLIYGFFMILRKSMVLDGHIFLTADISGEYSPATEIRGHNLCYTASNNTYDAWTREQYRRYILDLTAFGCNMAEDAPRQNNETGPLMKMTKREALVCISEICCEFDLGLTVYYPLDKALTDGETVSELTEAIKDLPVLSRLFLPGGDPGNLPAADFVKRCRAIKKAVKELYPEIEVIPSAQAPHEYPDWGKDFKKAMAEMPEEIDAVIYGPNHAMPLDELRRSVDIRYPLEQYADITHNVRCETPVHFTRDDWHFAWASTLSRESVNPRPAEYRLLHEKTRQYLRGGIPYSEGVNDDVNKTVWSALDFDHGASLRETLKDYARLYMPGTVAGTVADLIFGLEQNWQNAPEESASVDFVYSGFEKMLRSNPALYGNWRFMLLYFRSLCDKLVRDRRITELELVKKAEKEIKKGNMAAAEIILSRGCGEEYDQKRKMADDTAKILFDLISIQLDVARFGGKNPERGCTLDTLDMPVTDRQYLLGKIREGISADGLKRIIGRTETETDEYYYSVALNGLLVSGPQEGEFYLNFRGDKNGDGKFPTALLNGFDHFNFSMNIAGLTGGDYLLRITFADALPEGSHFRAAVNGHTLYEGTRFGERDTEYEKEFLPAGLVSAVYRVPAEFIENGCALLELTEDTEGFIMYEFMFSHAVTE